MVPHQLPDRPLEGRYLVLQDEDGLGELGHLLLEELDYLGLFFYLGHGWQLDGDLVRELDWVLGLHAVVVTHC